MVGQTNYQNIDKLNMNPLKILKLSDRCRLWVKENDTTYEEEWARVQAKESKMPSVLRSYLSLIISNVKLS
jgi:hypothetical protein